MITLDDRLQDTAEDLRRVATRLPDRGLSHSPRSRGRVGGWVAASIGVAALIALPIWLGAFDADPPLGGASDLETIEDILIQLDRSVSEAEGRQIADQLHETWPAVEKATWISAEEARDLASTRRPPGYNTPSIDHFYASIRVKLFADTDPLQRRQTAGGISNALGDRAVGVTVSLGPDDTDDPGVTTTGPEADPAAGAQVELVPIRVECTSELAAFPCSALIDGDPTTSWMAPDGGIGAELTFYFQPAVQISHLAAENLRDECQFMRNARIRGVEVELNDIPWLHIQDLEDTNATSQEITLDSTHTSRVVMTITSAHVSSSCDDREPFVELALQGVTFFGRVAPSG